MSPSPHGAGAEAERDEEVVVWHELECGRYAADAQVWVELARANGALRVLDVGAGTGRVSLPLARAGYELCALDIDARLLARLERRAAEDCVRVQTLCADARGFELPDEPPFDLCVVPMQTIQLLGGPEGRLAFMRRALAHLRPGAPLAVAIVTDFEAFDIAEGRGVPEPEVARVRATEYRSQPTAVRLHARTVEIERLRTIGSGVRGLRGERDVIVLDRVSVEDLEREGRAAGFRPGGVLEIAATEEHVGSEVVVLRA